MLIKQSRLNNKFLTLLNQARNRPLVIAHRGDSSHAPENTLEAVGLGHEVGADACEIDVQLTRDQRLVVVHDETLTRTTDVEERFADDSRALQGYLVHQFDLDEIRLLDAGSWFLSDPVRPRSTGHFGTRERIESEQAISYRSGRVRIPTLFEVLERVRDLDWLLNIEIKVHEKADGFALLDLVLKDVLETETVDRVLISSFDHRVVSEAARRVLAIATGILTSEAIADPRNYLRNVVGADAYHTSIEALGVPAEFDFPVLVYTVNDASAGGIAEALADWPVDGIFSDDPVALLDRLGDRARNRSKTN